VIDKFLKTHLEPKSGAMRMSGVVEGGMSMAGKAAQSTRNTADYLAQLLMDKKTVDSLSTCFPTH